MGVARPRWLGALCFPTEASTGIDFVECMFIRFVRKFHAFLSDSFIKIPVRLLRGLILGSAGWRWRVRDIVADFVPLQSGLADGVELLFTNKGAFVKAVDGFQYEFDIKGNQIPEDTLKGIKPVDPLEVEYALERLRGGIIIDGGAGVGDYALNFSRKAEVHSFEPMAYQFRRLVKNVERNKANVICNQMGLWEETGTFGLTEIDDDDNRLVPVDSKKAFETIKTIRLDDYLDSRGIERVGLIKADIQGAELEMIKSLGKYMDSRPALLLEIVPRVILKFGHHYSELFEYLIGLGYGYVGFYEDGTIHKEHYESMIGHSYNFYFEI
jgi:FkbM family methyltransferase